MTAELLLCNLRIHVAKTKKIIIFFRSTFYITCLVIWVQERETSRMIRTVTRYIIVVFILVEFKGINLVIIIYVTSLKSEAAAACNHFFNEPINHDKQFQCFLCNWNVLYFVSCFYYSLYRKNRFKKRVPTQYVSNHLNEWMS